MGTRVRLQTASKTQIGILPRLFDSELRSQRFAGNRGDDIVRAFLRNATSDSREEPVGGEIVLQALGLLETHVRAQVANDNERIDAAPILQMQTPKGEVVPHALVRTGFAAVYRWQRYTPESNERPPHDGRWPWTRLSSEDLKPDVMTAMGPVTVAPNGGTATKMHEEREVRGRRIFDSRAKTVFLRFVAAWELPQWQELRTYVEAHPHQQYCWTDW